MSERHTRVYRIHGLGSADCAHAFENNVKHLPNVLDADVDFEAAEIRVVGDATIEELEQAGAFDHLKLCHEDGCRKQREPFWRQKENRHVLIAAVFLIVSHLLDIQPGSAHFLPAAGYLAAIIIGGGALIIAGLNKLMHGTFTMETLIMMAVIGAVAIGKWPEAATLVILFAVSEAMEDYASDQARKSLRALAAAAPEETVVRRNGREQTVTAGDLRIGDTMIIRPGQKLAADGVVDGGGAMLNQAAVTGESMPVYKTVGDDVFAGTLNEEGVLDVRVSKTAKESTISKIIRLVEESQATKAPAQAFVDRFAAVYTPVIIVLAFLVAVCPPLFAGAPWGGWIYRGLALLVVGCPCALVISIPVAVITAIGTATKNGVMIKGGLYLEQVGTLRIMAFDKTGTLTEGRPEVTDLVSFSGHDEKLLLLAAALERNARHPLAAAIVHAAEKRGLPHTHLPVSDFHSPVGKGVSARIDGAVYYFGRPDWVDEMTGRETDQAARERIAALQRQGKTVMVLGTEQHILGWIAAADQLRVQAEEAIRQLRRAGIEKTVLLTGDHRQSAEWIGRQAGISEIHAALLPEDKLAFIHSYQKEQGGIAMIGDGVNDAPALTAATVGIAMGGAGTDVALETADIALMTDDLRKLPYLVGLSRATLTVMKQNVAFSLAVKLLSLVLIFPGWLTLWMALLADVGTTLLVTLNSMRLARNSQ